MGLYIIRSGWFLKWLHLDLFFFREGKNTMASAMILLWHYWIFLSLAVGTKYFSLQAISTWAQLFSQTYGKNTQLLAAPSGQIKKDILKQKQTILREMLTEAPSAGTGVTIYFLLNGRTQKLFRETLQLERDHFSKASTHPNEPETEPSSHAKKSCVCLLFMVLMLLLEVENVHFVNRQLDKTLVYCTTCYSVPSRNCFKDWHDGGHHKWRMTFRNKPCLHGQKCI